MIEALITLALALLLAFLGTTPAWLAKVSLVGGIAFVLYVVILVVRWLVARA